LNNLDNVKAGNVYEHADPRYNYRRFEVLSVDSYDGRVETRGIESGRTAWINLERFHNNKYYRYLGTMRSLKIKRPTVTTRSTKPAATQTTAPSYTETTTAPAAEVPASTQQPVA